MGEQADLEVVPAGGGPARQLLRQAADGVLDASVDRVVVRRFATAHLAALRAAAAVLAERAVPARDRPADAWGLLGAVAPELGEWAEFFASWSPARRPVRTVTAREADDMVRQVEQFLTLAEAAVRGRGPRARRGRAVRAS